MISRCLLGVLSIKRFPRGVGALFWLRLRGGNSENKQINACGGQFSCCLACACAVGSVLAFEVYLSKDVQYLGRVVVNHEWSKARMMSKHAKLGLVPTARPTAIAQRFVCIGMSETKKRWPQVYPIRIRRAQADSEGEWKRNCWPVYGLNEK